MVLKLNLLITKFTIMKKKEVTQLSYEIIGLAIRVHKELGPGLLESVYEKCLKYELELNGYSVKKQVNVPVKYRDMEMDVDLRLDLLVNDTIVVELKAVETVLNQNLRTADIYTEGDIKVGTDAMGDAVVAALKV